MAQLRDPIASNVVQAHPLLSPPLPWHQNAPSVCLSTFSKDAAVHYVPCNCLLLYIDVMLDCVHPTLLEYLVGWRVNPLAVGPPSRYLLLCHPICRADMETFKPSHDSLAQDPRLASVQEDRLHNCLIELCTSPWRCVLPTLHLSHPCPHPSCLLKLIPHGLDIVVVLQEQVAEVSVDLDLLQYVPMQCELLAQSKR